MDGKELKKLREELEMTQEEIARYLQVSLSGYRNWETGRQPITHLIGEGIKSKLKFYKGE